MVRGRLLVRKGVGSGAGADGYPALPPPVARAVVPGAHCPVNEDCPSVHLIHFSLGWGTTRYRVGSSPALARSGFAAWAAANPRRSPDRSRPSTRLPTRRTDAALPPTRRTSTPS